MSTAPDLENRPLVFIHLQRCGGSTLTQVLDLYFNNRSILKANLIHGENDRVLGIAGHTGEPIDLDPDLSGYRLIAGHNNFGDVDALLQNPMYLTMMRNPVGRVVSLYRYWKSHRQDYIDEHDLRGPRLAKNLPLVDFVRSNEPEALYNVQNGMARQLVNHMIAPLDMTDAELLERAGQNLSRFAFVGITELYALSVNLMEEALDLGPRGETETANAFKQNVERGAQFEDIPEDVVDAETTACIVERNWVDLQLYNRALRDLGRRMDDEAERAPGTEIQRPLLLKKIARRISRILTDYVHPV